MTHDEIIDECLGHAVGMFERQRLTRMCRMAAAAEREACLQVALTLDLTPITEEATARYVGMTCRGDETAQAWQADNIAAAIRKRGDDDPT